APRDSWCRVAPSYIPARACQEFVERDPNRLTNREIYDRLTVSSAGPGRFCSHCAHPHPFRGGLNSVLEVQHLGRRGSKEDRAPEALTLVSLDREHAPLVCPSCGTRSIQRVPRRRGSRDGIVLLPRSERITLTCQTCGRHASYIERGPEPPRDSTMD